MGTIGQGSAYLARSTTPYVSSMVVTLVDGVYVGQPVACPMPLKASCLLSLLATVQNLSHMQELVEISRST